MVTPLRFESLRFGYFMGCAASMGSTASGDGEVPVILEIGKGPLGVKGMMILHGEV